MLVFKMRHEFKSSNMYDRILCDVPCSGYGVLSRKPDIKLHMVPEDMDIIDSFTIFYSE